MWADSLMTSFSSSDVESKYGYKNNCKISLTGESFEDYKFVDVTVVEDSLPPERSHLTWFGRKMASSAFTPAEPSERLQRVLVKLTADSLSKLLETKASTSQTNKSEVV